MGNILLRLTVSTRPKGGMIVKPKTECFLVLPDLAGNNEWAIRVPNSIRLQYDKQSYMYNKLSIFLQKYHGRFHLRILVSAPKWQYIRARHGSDGGKSFVPHTKNHMRTAWYLSAQVPVLYRAPVIYKKKVERFLFHSKQGIDYMLNQIHLDGPRVYF